MSQDSGVLPAFRSLAIFIAFASVFYFLLVWNPVGSLSDVRNYFAHRVRVPVEWIAVAFPVAWLIQRNHGYTTAAAVFIPIAVLILTLTSPHHGAEYLSILRYEIYLDPFYAKRGLLVCFFLLSIVVVSRIRWNHRGVLLLCLIIGFAVTSWEALIAPSPPNTFEGGGWFVGWWTEPMHAGWGRISSYISQHIPPDYQDATRVGLSLYPFLAFFLLLFPSLALIVLVLTSIVWIPAGLFLLPAWIFWALSQPLKIAYFLVLKGPFMVLHYLHYLMVLPHPVEEVVKQYEAVKSRREAVDYRLFAQKMARARYNLLDGIPAWWKSKNWERRLKDIMALRSRVQSEKTVADEYTEEFRKHHRENK